MIVWYLPDTQLSRLKRTPNFGHTGGSRHKQFGHLQNESTPSFGLLIATDFSVVLFRPHFMVASKEHLMKVHKNQWLLILPSPPDLHSGAIHQGTYHGVWGADAFAVA